MNISIFLIEWNGQDKLEASPKLYLCICQGGLKAYISAMEGSFSQ